MSGGEATALQRDTHRASWEQKAAPRTGDAALWFWGPPDPRVASVTCERGGEREWGGRGRLPAARPPALRRCHPPSPHRDGSWLPERSPLADTNSCIRN